MPISGTPDHTPPAQSDLSVQQGEKAQKTKDDSKVTVTQQDHNFMVSVFMALLSSVSTVSSLVQTQSSKIEYNSNLQSKMNQGMGKMQNLVVPNNASSTQLKQVEQINANITIVRQNTQGQVLGLRQTGQQLSAQAQVLVNYMQQGGSETTAVLKTLLTVMKLINKISPAGN